MLDTIAKHSSPRTWYAAAVGLLTFSCVCLLALESAVFLPSVPSFQSYRFHHHELTADVFAVRRSPSFRYAQMHTSGNDQHELMTPALLETTRAQDSDCLDPVQVHLLWIGDVSKAPKEIVQYTEQGFNITVHTSVDEILEGFQPFVRKAFELAIPTVVGYDFLKFLLLYKYGGFVVDADTTPQLPAAAVAFPVDCSVIFGKEAHMPKEWFTAPQYREEGGATYPLVRPYQLLNWAMAASTARNVHIGRLIEMCMMRFFGLRDMEYKLIQDIAGSGLMSDYFAMLYEREGKSYPAAFDNPEIVPVDGACMADELFTGKWIFHHYLGSWKLRQQQEEAEAAAAKAAAEAEVSPEATGAEAAAEAEVSPETTGAEAAAEAEVSPEATAAEAAAEAEVSPETTAAEAAAEAEVSTEATAAEAVSNANAAP
ncbi:hypothetical protein Gpo141_00004239 [Globisporangium polare]